MPEQNYFPLFESCKLLHLRQGAPQPLQPLMMMNIETHATDVIPITRVEITKGRVVIQMDNFDDEQIGSQPPMLGDIRTAYFIELASLTLKGAEQTLRSNCGACKGIGVCKPKAAMNLRHSGILLEGFHQAPYVQEPIKPIE